MNPSRVCVPPAPPPPPPALKLCSPELQTKCKCKGSKVVLLKAVCFTFMLCWEEEINSVQQLNRTEVASLLPLVAELRAWWAEYGGVFFTWYCHKNDRKVSTKITRGKEKVKYPGRKNGMSPDTRLGLRSCEWSSVLSSSRVRLCLRGPLPLLLLLSPPVYPGWRSSSEPCDGRLCSDGKPCGLSLLHYGNKFPVLTSKLRMHVTVTATGWHTPPSVGANHSHGSGLSTYFSSVEIKKRKTERESSTRTEL